LVRIAAVSADLLQLRFEFRLRRHLLEQPPSHVAHLYGGDGRNAVGKLAPAVLAVVIPLRYRVDGGNHFTAAPTALYGLVLLMAAIAYYLLQQTIIRAQGNDSILKKAVGRDWKGKLSLVLYVVAIVATLHSTWIAQGIFVAAALIWLVPDRRIKRVLLQDRS
jgi:hypothetical protein